MMPVSSKFKFEVEGLRRVIFFFFFYDQPLQSESQHKPAEPFAGHGKSVAFFCFSTLSFGRWGKAMLSTKFIWNVLVLQEIT